MVSWAERLRTDKSLKAFCEAYAGQLSVRNASLEADNKSLTETVEAQARLIKELKAKKKD